MIVDTYPLLANATAAATMGQPPHAGAAAAVPLPPTGPSTRSTSFSSVSSAPSTPGNEKSTSATSTPAHSSNLPNVNPPKLAASDLAEEMMWEEQLRVLSVSITELHNLVQQRKKSGSTEHAYTNRSHTATLQYSTLNAEQAHSLTSHLLLTSNLLIQQLTYTWTKKLQHKDAQQFEQFSPHHCCHDPSPLPWPQQDVCTCRGRASPSTTTRTTAPISPTAAAAANINNAASTNNNANVAVSAESNTGNETSTPNTADSSTAGLKIRSVSDASSTYSPAFSSASPSSASSPTLTSSTAPVRRTVLPFSNICLLEKNILAGRTARGHQLRQQQSKQGTPSIPATPEPGLSTSSSFASLNLDLHSVNEHIHPRDLVLLQTHFLQLLAYPSLNQLQPHQQQQAIPLLRSPLGLTHPFGLLIREFLLHFEHQANYLQTMNIPPQNSVTTIPAARPIVAIDRNFLNSQLSALFNFLSAHETLIVLSYPHLYQTNLCKKMLRLTLRTCIVDQPVVMRAMASWYEECHREEENELSRKMTEMKDLQLSELGVPFPYNLSTESLLATASKSAAAALAASTDADHHDIDGDEEHDEEHDTDVPIDQLIHSDEEDDMENSIGTAAQRKARSPKSRRANVPPIATGVVVPQPAPVAAGMRQNNSSNALSFLSSSPRLTYNLPTTQLSQASVFVPSSIPVDSVHLTRATTDPSSLLVTGSYIQSGTTPPSPSSRFSSPSQPGRQIYSATTTPVILSSAASAAPVFPAIPSVFETTSPTIPYTQSISILASLDIAQTIDAKIAVVVACCRSITKEFHAFLDANGLNALVDQDQPENEGSAGRAGGVNLNGEPLPHSKTYAMCADDLFVCLAYVLLQAGLATPIATVNMLADLMEGHQLNGEGGYCLTSLQCAVQVIQTWSRESVAEADHIRKLSHSLQEQEFFRHMSRSSSMSSVASTSSSATNASIASSVSQSPLKSHHHTNEMNAAYAAQLGSAMSEFLVASDYKELDSQWQWLFDKDGVTVFRKKYPNQSIYAIKGVSVIHRPPHVIQNFLKKINNRSYIDDIFIDGRVLTHLTPDTKIVQYRFKARNWCARQQTDMVLLHHQSVASDGVTLVTLAFSVTFPGCPPQADFTRASVRASGWLLKPTNHGTSTHCTYLIHPDSNGWAAWLVNLVSQKQPMLIRNVREYLYANTIVKAAEEAQREKEQQLKQQQQEVAQAQAGQPKSSSTPSTSAENSTAPRRNSISASSTAPPSQNSSRQ